MSNIIAIVGRPNVGKSTLFNRLTKSRTAIEAEMSGVTSDRIYGVSEWNGVEFSVIDTGGYVRGSDDIFEEEIAKSKHFTVVEEPGPDTLIIRGGLLDIISKVPPAPS